jgi:hypothetical protein
LNIYFILNNLQFLKKMPFSKENPDFFLFFL